MMDEIEFRKRVYANPGSPDQEVLDAARDNPTYQSILEQTQALNGEMSALLSSVVIPEGLKESLLEIPGLETDEEVSASGVAAVGAVAEQPAANAASFFQYYAIAASLLLVVGVTFTLSFDSGPSITDLALGDEAISHIYHESTYISDINTGINLVNVEWNDVNEVMAEAGVRMASTLQTGNPVYYANPCIILQEYSSAHLMLKGEAGAVSVIVIQNSPVESQYQFSDDRFRGMVVPMDEGNLILIGEEGENLEPFKQLVSDNMEWVI